MPSLPPSAAPVGLPPLEVHPVAVTVITRVSGAPEEFAPGTATAMLRPARVVAVARVERGAIPAYPRSFDPRRAKAGPAARGPSMALPVAVPGVAARPYGPETPARGAGVAVLKPTEGVYSGRATQMWRGHKFSHTLTRSKFYPCGSSARNRRNLGRNRGRCSILQKKLCLGQRKGGADYYRRNRLSAHFRSSDGHCCYQSGRSQTRKDRSRRWRYRSGRRRVKSCYHATVRWSLVRTFLSRYWRGCGRWRRSRSQNRRASKRYLGIARRFRARRYPGCTAYLSLWSCAVFSARNWRRFKTSSKNGRHNWNCNGRKNDANRKHSANRHICSLRSSKRRQSSFSSLSSHSYGKSYSRYRGKRGSRSYSSGNALRSIRSARLSTRPVLTHNPVAVSRSGRKTPRSQQGVRPVTHPFLVSISDGSATSACPGSWSPY